MLRDVFFFPQHEPETQMEENVEKFLRGAETEVHPPGGQRPQTDQVLDWSSETPDLSRPLALTETLLDTRSTDLKELEQFDHEE